MSLITKTNQGYQLQEATPVFNAQHATDVGEYLKRKIGRQLQEHLIVLSLNAVLEVVSVDTVAIGQVDNVQVTPREVFQIALLNNAQRIIIAHNHPSGHVSPSMADNTFTKNLKEVGELMKLPVIDHFIVGTQSYFSYAEEGRMSSLN
ncbi:MAG: JAB domain-containing protein [Leuconostoc lactis]|uniref:JAB domain-containing protein n=1 Tax=Leuconostoc lactis TaxID=1246 RepID=UPI0039945A2D